MSELRELFSRLDDVLPADRRELRARLGGLEKRFRDGAVADQRALAAVAQAIERSAAERGRRRGLVPAINFPAELPVSNALPALREAFAQSQVVVVAGETGSGKSTQLPKLCLELGRGVNGRIAHTQPRRIAARSVARRIAEELGVKLGGVVGVKVRFGDETSRDTLIKVMTDGILLAETRGDARLDAYDTIILDEAHERSLNIDFLLGFIKRLLPRRPDLKVVLTSATIDVERLSAHFGGCPIVEIPGRSHPIEYRYRPLDADDVDEEDPRMLDAIARAVDEVDEAFAPALVPDMLLFLSGEREIREVEAHLHGHLKSRGTRAAQETEVLPLFARQGLEEQDRIFAPGRRRRIVLATNVAETSLTVPRIHAVIDPGYARVLRYSAKSRVQRLPIEPISQASARQRAGRAGRLGPGIVVRLYAEENFTARAPFTQPEILRTNLASVILQMEALSLGKAEDFPFVDPPSARLLADGRATLVELGASTDEGKLTKIGRAMSLLPLDPRLSRMMLASIDERCTNDALIVAAGLAVQDPRVRPQEKRDAADFAHARFRDPTSDFVSFLRLWRAWRAETKDLGSAARRRWCEKNHLSHQRMREWADTASQLRDLFFEHFQIKVGEPSDEVDQGRFHRAVIAGFASHVGSRNEKGEYRGPSGALFALHPSSTLAKRGPNWVVAAEVVETTRRYARVCARIQPEWIVRVAPHLCTRTQFEPHFLEETGQVSAWERTSFGEIVVIPKRRVPWGPIDPAGARNVFIQEGLVGYRARTAGEFLDRNRELRLALEEEEARGRRRGLLLEEEAAFAFYDARIPAEIRSTPSFESWRREAERADPMVLWMRDDDLIRDGAERTDASRFPPTISVDALAVPLAYTHDPDLAHDGVTARIPVEALAVIDPTPFEWMVPGLLTQKVEALVRSLPKQLRVRLFPIEEVVQGAVETLEFGRGSLFNRLARHLSTVAGTEIASRDFRTELLPSHLTMRFSVVDADGSELGSGRDLAALAKSFASVARDRLRASIDRTTDPVAALERNDVGTMPDQAIPEQIEYFRAGIALVGHPALAIEANGERFAVRVFDSPVIARDEHMAAVSLLHARDHREAVEHHLGYHPLCEELSELLGRAGVGEPVDFVARSVAMQALGGIDHVPRSAAELIAVSRATARGLHDAVAYTARSLHAILIGAEEIMAKTGGIKPDSLGEPKARILARLASVLGAHRLEPVVRSDRDELAQKIRLVTMLVARLERLREIGSARDRALDDELEPLRRRVGQARSSRNLARSDLRAMERMLDEIEISRFAPKLPRAFPASERRLEQLIEQLIEQVDAQVVEQSRGLFRREP